MKITDVPVETWFIDGFGDLLFKDDSGKFICFGNADNPYAMFVWNPYDLDDVVIKVLEDSPFIPHKLETREKTSDTIMAGSNCNLLARYRKV